MYNKFLLLISIFIFSNLYSQQTFQLNSNGTSYIYWPFPNSSYSNTRGWSIRGYNHGEGDHFGGDYYAEDWGLAGNTDCDSIFRSPISGTVLFAGPGGEPGYGNQVVVRSNTNNLFAFRISHLVSVSCSTGQPISIGDVLGRIGNTGFSDYCHAHCVLYKNITSLYNGVSGVTRLQGGYGLGFSGPANTFAAQYLFSATQSPGPISCNFRVNNIYSLNGWKFWKNYNYTIRVAIANRPAGNSWTLFLVDSSGVVIPPNPLTGENVDSTTFNFNIPLPGNNYPNRGGYRFRLCRNDPPNYTLWGLSPTFYISALPSVTVTTEPLSQMQIGSSAKVRWVVSGGIPGLTNGGWIGGIRLQWYQDTVPLANLIFETPVINGVYNFTVPSTLSGATIPGCNFKIAGVNSESGTSMPPSSVLDFSDPFCIVNPNGIIPIGEEIPNTYMLHQNYPNPFNPATNIQFDVPESGNIKLSVYDVSGNEVIQLVNQDLKSGSYRFNWDATNFSSGIYFYTLKGEGFIQTKKMTLLK